MNLSEPELETRLRHALTDATAPIHGDGVEHASVLRTVTRRRRTRWATRAGLAAAAAAATVALVVVTRPDGGRVDTADHPSTTSTTEPAPSSSTSSSTTSTTSTTPSSTSASTTSGTPAGSAAPPVAPVGPDTPVSRTGIGPIRAGMTVREAAVAGGVTITPGEPIGEGSNCVEAQIEDHEIYLQLEISGAPGEDLTQGVVRLVAGQDVRTTVEGVAVGDPVAEVTTTYGNPTRTIDYPYLPNSEVLVFEETGHAYGIVVDGTTGTVAQIQSGDAAWVPSIEGCV